MYQTICPYCGVLTSNPKGYCSESCYEQHEAELAISADEDYDMDYEFGMYDDC